MDLSVKCPERNNYTQNKRWREKKKKGKKDEKNVKLMEDIPLVTMHFRRKDRPPLSLTICAGDEPLQLAVTFAAAHALPSICIPRLKEQIVFHKDTALANLSLNNLENEKNNIEDQNSLSIDLKAISQQPQPAVNSKIDYDLNSQNSIVVATSQNSQQINISVESKNVSDLNSHVATTPQQFHRVNESVDYENAFDLNSHAATPQQSQLVNESIDNEKAYDLLREKWLPSQNSNVIGQGADRNVIHAARNQLIPLSTPPRSSQQRSLSAPPKISSDRSSDKQQIMYDRLYNEGRLSKDRIEKLREKILSERSQIIQRSSFRETLKRKSSERANTRRSVSNPRPPMPSKSSSDAPLPNQHVFEKLYNFSHYSRLRLNSLKERLEKEEQLSIERSSFR